ncbi:hypothetical protein LZ3411_2199 [Levilactobacillus zymae]|uniref:Uncharacterized protein n=1 Tax=Levilactobacillus zymae TaxID=267363 RepID=A0A1Y6JZ85_9LACO|nr:hypothetical protein LZ3411_2199 [Levilactobacillus zymae]
MNDGGVVRERGQVAVNPGGIKRSVGTSGSFHGKTLGVHISL